MTDCPYCAPDELCGLCWAKVDKVILVDSEPPFDEHPVERLDSGGLSPLWASVGAVALVLGIWTLLVVGMAQ